MNTTRAQDHFFGLATAAMMLAEDEPVAFLRLSDEKSWLPHSEGQCTIIAKVEICEARLRR